jgi:hypothetical protein
MALLWILSSVSRSRKSKTAANLEILVSQFVYKIATKFQRLSPSFRDPGTNWRYCGYCPVAAEAENPRRRQLNRKYLHLGLYSIHDSNVISTATPMFSMFSNSVTLLRMLPALSGRQKFKMAAAKPEIPVSRLVYKIATKFQQLHTRFLCQELNDAIADTVWGKQKAKDTIHFLSKLPMRMPICIHYTSRRSEQIFCLLTDFDDAVVGANSLQ